MSLVINLYGGPGTGKSTTAAHLFALLKSRGVNAELVQEYVKQWAWESRKPVNYDQFYFFGKQSRKEYSLFGAVDVIITDAPVCLGAYYTELFGTSEQADLFKKMAKVYYDMVSNDGHQYLHIWLNRVKPYNPSGRFQTAEQALEIDKDMKRMLTTDLGLKLLNVDGSEDGVRHILEMLAVEKLIPTRSLRSE